jgi:hypothetical protein
MRKFEQEERKELFSEKRSKKLLPLGVCGSHRNTPRRKGFLALFFKK